MPFRFVHTADLHLDSPLRSLALKNVELAELVRGATRTALSSIVDLCIAEAVDALLIAGDLYDGSQTSMNTALFLSTELRRLEQAGIPVFIIRGNHDSQSTIKRELSLPANVHLFSGRIKSVRAKTLDNGREVYVHGVGFDNPHAPESLLSSFAGPMADAINIGMLHTSLAGAPGHDPYAPASVADLAAHGFDYWALGHVHLRQVHSEKPVIVMPGMPQGRDINEAGDKSVTLVTVGDNGTIFHEERRIGQAAFHRLSVELTGADDWQAMLARVRAAIADARDKIYAEQLIFRIVLTGTTSLAWSLRRDPEFLQAEISNVTAGFPGCWAEAVEVSCRNAESDATQSAADPVHELALTVHGDVLGSHAFRQEAERIVEELLAQLPRELREQMAGDEAALGRLVETVSREGSDDMLAYLQAGRADGEGAR
ncbi:DNA repair exonuclease SbcCD nuclease subunit [Pararhizobium capsulatum DSM 1112]|uniref:DNA repair exonuclease SbcCD nuclease subunit n=1 Tax=Pararhizobium capsulatum DSM 1112 TaxID=1121113 RepID=A0ABU0BNQ4_9HYPH|nr:exonuclease SbcCD subunit D [Pararhizobium capsulatum]MDQ0319891.1 DNA repair exonuclease SbcCD nuclease subunit [Pararhizobium capsulatum DSM 1112]